ncbi:hypothetical protein PBOI14_24480 [Pseudomonas sp. Boi14]|nr:hypothetical protein PBOI14_24480 [Pseudomonas sp. Boi14]
MELLLVIAIALGVLAYVHYNKIVGAHNRPSGPGRMC